VIFQKLSNFVLEFSKASRMFCKETSGNFLLLVYTFSAVTSRKFQKVPSTYIKGLAAALKFIVKIIVYLLIAICKFISHSIVTVPIFCYKTLDIGILL